MKVKIISSKDGSFPGQEGETITYFYHKAIVLGGDRDGVNFEFGSPVQHADGMEKELDIIRFEKSNGKIGWKEVVRRNV